MYTMYTFCKHSIGIFSEGVPNTTKCLSLYIREISSSCTRPVKGTGFYFSINWINKKTEQRGFYK
jgi:hypothetical protein